MTPHVCLLVGRSVWPNCPKWRNVLFHAPIGALVTYSRSSFANHFLNNCSNLHVLSKSWTRNGAPWEKELFNHRYLGNLSLNVFVHLSAESSLPVNLTVVAHDLCSIF